MICLHFLCLVCRINDGVFEQMLLLSLFKGNTRMNCWVTELLKFYKSTNHHMCVNAPFIFSSEECNFISVYFRSVIKLSEISSIGKWLKTWRTQRAFSRMAILIGLSSLGGHTFTFLQNYLVALKPSWLAVSEFCHLQLMKKVQAKNNLSEI